jgi:hypothetical protein
MTDSYPDTQCFPEAEQAPYLVVADKLSPQPFWDQFDAEERARDLLSHRNHAAVYKRHPIPCAGGQGWLYHISGVMRSAI